MGGVIGAGLVSHVPTIMLQSSIAAERGTAVAGS